ncbi:MAG TPA: vanadium-dependent haloperoxidase [Thermoanaerobaculia bacterium]|nr:vanadium-dependent haloperoxidase [Thermoanaerobaculia bacterium]
MISISELTRYTDNEEDPCYFPPYPADSAVVEDEINELIELASLRDDPQALFSSRPCRERREISPFLQYRPQPLGAVFNLERDPAFMVLRRGRDPEPNLLEILRGEEEDAALPVIRTGRELARYFEAETPGLAHRQALNLLLRDASWSPPRQAWVWAALDITIYSALLAAWYYKWIAGVADPECRQGERRMGVSFRPRPFEYDSRVGVLYNREVSSLGDGDGARRLMPNPSPGTPRHPSYPSGHSTYGAAASELLSWFFPDYREEFNRLADNTGMARLWAGIHYRSDHIQGGRLGRCVACRVIEQLERSCIPRTPDECRPPRGVLRPRGPCDLPPSQGELCEAAEERKDSCPCERPSHKVVAEAEAPEERAPEDRPSSEEEREEARGPQQGAQGTSSNQGSREHARGPQKGAR